MKSCENFGDKLDSNHW